MSRINSGRTGSYTPPTRNAEQTASIHERRKHEDHARRKPGDRRRDKRKGHDGEEAFRVSVSDESGPREDTSYAGGPGRGADPGQDEVAALLLGRAGVPAGKKDHRKREENPDDTL